MIICNFCMENAYVVEFMFCEKSSHICSGCVDLAVETLKQERQKKESSNDE
jgi:ATP-dependent protease Clp ATPase subunit